MNHNLTLNEIREKGLNALTKDLTPTEVAKFFQMFEKGEGDYTVEKKNLYKNKSIDSIYQEVISSRSISRKKIKPAKLPKANIKKRKVA
ncbi:MAG TPA: hypothetical protein PLX69_24325 [Leptospiraceae bacterium]|nr:hypothetical protein [Leptospiraceae bacterium]